MGIESGNKFWNVFLQVLREKSFQRRESNLVTKLKLLVRPTSCFFDFFFKRKTSFLVHDFSPNQLLMYVTA